MASDNNLELSRRKILAGMGAVGAAGAGAGIGTSALFNDTESFENNEVVAGQLDLKMDWEEHYSYPQIYDDFSDPTVETDSEGDDVDLDVVRTNPNDSRYVGLPDPDNPVVWANDEDDPKGTDQSSLELYFQNTTIEAFPDRQGGENENPEATFTMSTDDGEPVFQNPCDALADVPGDRDSFATSSTPARSKNGDTFDGTNALPLLNLTDVKPGDFGEFTFSAHLCDNPGYLWLQMPGGLDESENSLTDPEDDVDDTPSDGELAENVQTALWYDDDCNNRIQSEPDDLVALAIVDTSASTSTNLQSIIDTANALAVDLYEATQQNPDLGIQAGVITFEDIGDTNDPVLASPIQPVSNYVDTSTSPVQGEFGTGNILPDSRGSGNSPIQHAMDTGRHYLNDKAASLDSSSNNIDDPDKQMLVISDGTPVINAVGEDQFGKLRNPDDSEFTFEGTSYESDAFDGKANDENVEFPNPNNPPGGESLAEAVLVARDIDGEPFLPDSSTYTTQTAGPKVDNPEDQPEGFPNLNDPADISGDNGIIIRAAAVYSNSDSQTTKDLARDSMTAIATGDLMYDIPTAGGASVGGAIATDILGNGTGEEVIFRGTLGELELLLDPAQEGPGQSQAGPLPLDFDRTTDEQDCYPPGVTHCFGLAWWVPTSVGNEIQSDSASFDLGFVTEQCRNNDDPGQTVFGD